MKTSKKIVWLRADGSIVACTEKIKVLGENLDELRQVAQDALDDAILMEVDEAQIREVFRRLIEELINPYGPS